MIGSMTIIMKTYIVAIACFLLAFTGGPGGPAETLSRPGVQTTSAKAKAQEKLERAVLAVITAQPSYWFERCPAKAGVTLPCEPKAERRARLRPAAAAIARAALRRPGGWEPVRVAAAEVAVGQHETNWARYVWEGCLAFPHAESARCDPLRLRGGEERAQSLTFWQLKTRACTLVHAAPPARMILEEPRRRWAPEWSERQAFNGARCASERFVGAYQRCKGQNPDGDLAGAFSGYRSVGCRWTVENSEGEVIDGGGVRAKTLLWVESRLRQELAA